jgi:hypothetical protein
MNSNRSAWLSMCAESMFSCSIALVDMVGKEILASTEFASESSDKVMAVKCEILANS